MSTHTGPRSLGTVEHWLLSTLADSRGREIARWQWRELGVAMLPLGGVFSVVRLPARLVHAVAGSSAAGDVDAFLDQALGGGPVISVLHGGARYYAFVPASVPRTWRDAAEEWRAVEVDCLGRGAYLGVPPPARVEFDAGTWASYWAVPVASAGELCSPLSVARLIAAGVHLTCA
ncbi:hypothetical protein [Streptomyces sp. Amel2xC10]|uniref:hypothetical protein n=1 Tax=Streptomyces sp. Amel2xC10 TaxID=1305826 RepID=UPI000A0824F7|nr:hypothetical protein [Streptomyces sp. Amel2xC10]SME93583.1 hypothetical protein SAMN02745830_00606 [Streptomyces sp. Amel2xC10]